MWRRQQSYLSAVDAVSVVFNISSSHVNTKFYTKRSLYVQLLILLIITITRIRIPHFHNFNQPVLYIHMDIYHGSTFALNYMHFHLISLHTHMIHAKLLFIILLTSYFLLYLEHIFKHMDPQWHYKLHHSW